MENFTEQEMSLAPQAADPAELQAENEALRAELETLRAENDAYENEMLAHRMAADLAEIRKLDADVESLESLGEEFAALIAAGVPPQTAFRALHPAAERPPEVGALEQRSATAKEFYSAAEVDALPPEALEDPAVWEVVRASMTKW